MKIQKEILIEDLIERTRQNLNEVQKLKELPLKKLNLKPSPESWSALEAIEHLNRYGEFYLPEIRNRIKSAPEKQEAVFKGGWIGNKFAKMMLPGTKKMKTFKDKDPAGSNLSVKVLDEFISQQKETLDLLSKARRVSLTKIKTSISISKLIKLKLGDTLRVVIYHNQRHLQQAKRAAES